MSTLFLVGTPIGNLGDMTFRAIEVLRSVAVIAAEDTRSARRLLSHFDVPPPRMVSYTEHNRGARIPSLIASLDEGDVAVVSDAGMPGISDPGHELVTAAIAAGHTVVPVPGASAVIAAVAASGLPSRRYHYLGFLPRQSGARRRAIVEAARSGDTLVVFESPHRVMATLEDVRETLGGDRLVAVCRELTKLHEEIWRGTAAEAVEQFAEPRGEFTLVIEGGLEEEAPRQEDVAAAIRELRANAMSARDGIAELQRRFGMGRRAAYAAWHEGGGEA